MLDSENILASMPMKKLFFRLAIPAVLAQLVNILYNLVDKMFVGHIEETGAYALAGMGVATPVILCISAIAALVSMGGTPLASIMIGKGDKDSAEKILGTCTFTLLILSVIITVFMLCFGERILLMFGADEDTIGYAVSYMKIYCLGTVFAQLTLGLNAFITAQGDSRTSMVNVVIGAVVNVILDSIFIFGLHMGVQGAALATVIAQAVTSGFVLYYLLGDKSQIQLRKRYICFDSVLLGPCLLLGLSPALMQLTENLVAISFNTSLQKYDGTMAVSAMSILNSIMQFTMLILPGLVQGAQPILSYNLGAENEKRVKQCFRYLFLSCVSGSFFIWLCCMVAPREVAGIFTSDPELIAYTAQAMRLFLAMLLIYGVQVACQYSFVALNNARTAIFLTIWRKIILLIPLIFILPQFFSYNQVIGVFLAEPVADTIAVLTTGPMFFHFMVKRHFGLDTGSTDTRKILKTGKSE